MIYARPNNNGNSREDFVAAHYSLSSAERAIANAIIDIDLNIMHGRNYQHIPGIVAADMRKADLARLDSLRNVLTDITKLKLDIGNAAS